MNLDINQHDTYIPKPNDPTVIVRQAIPPPAQPIVEAPGAVDQKPAIVSARTSSKRKHPNYYGLRLANRGLLLLSTVFGMAATWYISAWVRHGRRPMEMSPGFSIYFGFTEPPILPPQWLLAVLGGLTLTSICLMLMGTQEDNPKIKSVKTRQSNKCIQEIDS